MDELYVEWVRLNDIVNAKSKALQEYPTGKLGLVVEEIRQNPKYIEACNQYNIAFQNLRNFNGNLTRGQKQKLHKIKNKAK